MNFASPVAITANTVYVASYYDTVGHWSFDGGYFSSKGMDNPPLHALTNGVSGGNGVFDYGASSAFPNQTYNANNYWVDVAFQPGAAPTLTSIVVTPANPTLLVGATQQFTATGTYSDGSTQNVTSLATWSSSSTAVATINASGLAAAVSSGSTTISAVLAGVTGSTLLTVQAPSVAITTTSLPDGVANAAYAATLTASGGTPPYTWSIASGSLPTGLALNATSGAIAGTPTTAAAFSFTAQATNAGNPVQSVAKPLSITVVSVTAAVSIWPATAVPGTVDGGPDSAVELGVEFRSDVPGSITGIRFYKATANTGTHVGHLWSSTGTLLASATFTGESASGWQQVNFASPVAITANTVYVASYHVTAGHYSEDDNYFASKGVDNPPLHALTNGVSGGNGVFAYGASSAFPNQTYNAANYWVDVVWQAQLAPTLTSIVVTPANPTLLVGATQQFTATGTYSDGSTLASTPVSIVVTGLPAPWQTTDIGSVGVAGSASMSNGLYTVLGTGNISGTADNFRFVYQPLSGDGEIKVRLNSVGTNAANSCIGVMVRESITAGSRYSFMGVGQTVRFGWQRRSTTAGSTSTTTSILGTTPNVWARLTRVGNTLTGYQSTDGTNWTQVNSRSITMATNIYVGLAVASGSSNTLNTATFTNVAVVPSAPRFDTESL